MISPSDSCAMAFLSDSCAITCPSDPHAKTSLWSSSVMTFPSDSCALAFPSDYCAMISPSDSHSTFSLSSSAITPFPSDSRVRAPLQLPAASGKGVPSRFPGIHPSSRKRRNRRCEGYGLHNAVPRQYHEKSWLPWPLPDSAVKSKRTNNNKRELHLSYSLIQASREKDKSNALLTSNRPTPEKTSGLFSLYAI